MCCVRKGGIALHKCQLEGKEGAGGRGCLGEERLGLQRPSLGAQFLALFSFTSRGKVQNRSRLGELLEVPDILLSDIRDEPTWT